MPSNNLYSTINYQIPKAGKFHNVGFQINGRYVFEQKNLFSFQDFVAPPESYYLIGLQVSSELQLRHLRINMFVRTENTFNESYRDYLNRQRYFADDMGFNMTVGVNLSF